MSKSVKQVTMTLARSATFATTTGHTIAFKKNIPTIVPQVAVRELAERGAIIADEDAAIFEEKEDVVAQTDPFARRDQIKDAIQRMVERGVREDFTASGYPNANVVSKEVGFKVQSKEVAPIWDEIRSTTGE